MGGVSGEVQTCACMEGSEMQVEDGRVWGKEGAEEKCER